MPKLRNNTHRIVLRVRVAGNKLVKLLVPIDIARQWQEDPPDEREVWEHASDALRDRMRITLPRGEYKRFLRVFKRRT